MMNPEICIEETMDCAQKLSISVNIAEETPETPEPDKDEGIPGFLTIGTIGIMMIAVIYRHRIPRVGED